MAKRGLLFILSAPSGAGKSTIAKSVVKKDKRFVLSVSHTTRHPRLGEVNGKDYHFVSTQHFEKNKKLGLFVESARVHGAWYATPKKSLKRGLRQGRYTLLTIDVVGAKNVAAAYPKDTVKIFLMPPNLKKWVGRLKKRKESDLKTRLAHARKEFQAMGSYHYTIINDNLADAVNDFFAIVRAEELKRQFIQLPVTGGVS